MMADVVVIGAGIGGVSTAYHLANRRGITNVVLVDPRAPLTLTSDKSTECYRNFWPNKPMVGLMNRSIDIYEALATEVEYGFNSRGYLFVTGNESNWSAMQTDVGQMAELGVEGHVLSSSELLSRYSFLTTEAQGGVFWPRAGWFRAQDLGQWMLDEARSTGVRLLKDNVVAVEPGKVLLASGNAIMTDQTVIAAGPMSHLVGAMAGLDLPLFSELHLKVSFKDHLKVIPRDATMTIWTDTQTIPWTDDERQELESMGRHDLTGEMPTFCHFRPEGGQDSPYIVGLWEYHDLVIEPEWPLPDDPLYPEVVLRGLTTMVPGLEVYLDRMPESVVDGGYYTKTVENRPLIGPSGVAGIHLLVGLSGFGVMASAGAADLLASHIAGDDLPWYAEAFSLDRYDDPGYLASLGAGQTGQL